ncbi:type II toxin-antitoxin system VapC family toxin [Leifsonia sp. RAF41]|uniref:type II toxin-antitoxin system VapC family toxin n=1 Tax=Leifsonia sp. RAF41 TaxID=3233056 RepID=UPI003F9A9392
MTVAYLDTSAAMKLLIREEETDAMFRELERAPLRLVASWLLHTELHCAAMRRNEPLDLDDIESLLDVVDLVDLTRGDLMTAALNTPLRSNDAIHLSTALRLGVDELLTYDEELARLARAVGVRVVVPT